MILISCARLSNFKGSLASAGLCLGIPLYRDLLIESNLFLQLTAFVERYWLHSHRLVNPLVHDKCGRMTWQGTVSRVQTGEEAPVDPSEVRKSSPKIRSVDAPYEKTKLLRGGKAKWECRSCPYPGFPYLDACDSIFNQLYSKRAIHIRLRNDSPLHDGDATCGEKDCIRKLSRHSTE